MRLDKKLQKADVTRTAITNSAHILRIVPYALIGILGVVSGLMLSPLFLRVDVTSDNSLEEIRLQKQYKFINPLLECNGVIGNYMSSNVIKRKVADYIEDMVRTEKIASAAVYYRNLNNGPWFGINETKLFTPASLIKVPLMITYFKKAEHDPTLLQKKLKTVTDVSEIIKATSLKPRVTLESNKEYSIQELIEHTIIYSDNTAYKTLKDNLTTQEFNEVFSDFGIDISRIENSKDENVISIHDYSSFFRILFNSSYLNRDYSEQALSILSKTDFKGGIVAGVPKNITVSHKFGERFYDEVSEKQLHDCGIVYKPTSPYMICVMTRGKDFAELTETIKGISSIVYESLEDLYN